jgi:hypothetical protein
LKKKLDVIQLLKKIQKIKLFTKISFNDAQQQMLKHTLKDKIYLEKDRRNRINVSEYLRQNLENKTVQKLDRILYENLDYLLKLELKEKLKKMKGYDMFLK